MAKRKYGWKRDLPDRRDKIFPLPKGKVLDVVDLREYCSPIENQSELGSCTANAIAGGLEFLEIKNGQPFVDFSRLFIYYNERMDDGNIPSDEGSTIRTGMRVLRQFGACDEKLWPYDIAKFAKKPPKKCYDDGLKHVISSYLRIKDLNGIMACLSSGYPVVFGFAVFESFETQEVAKTGMMVMPSTQEKMLGGHAVMICGYNRPKKILIVRNSWGTAWGECLAGDTEIDLLNGQSKSIKEIYEEGQPIWIYAVDEKTKRIVPAQAKPKFSGYRDDLVRVTLDNGESVACTQDHPWMLRDGSFKLASNLGIGESLMPLYTKDDKGYERFYTPESHKWVTTHWSVAHDLNLRDTEGHIPECTNDKCKLIIHHHDFNGRNNDPDNLKVMFECRHRQLHSNLMTPEEHSEKMKQIWRDNYDQMVDVSIRNISAYNENYVLGLIELTELQISSRQENGRKVGLLPHGPMTEKQRAAVRENARKMGLLPKTEEQRKSARMCVEKLWGRPRTEKQLVACRENIKLAHSKPLTEKQLAARRENGRKMGLKRRKAGAENAASNNHKVVSVEKLSLIMPVYDLEVLRKNCSNFALSAGVFVHNSGYFYMPFDYITEGFADDFWTIKKGIGM